MTSVSALTTVPTKTNFQGRLTNSAGNIMPDGTYNMKFRLFTVSSGGSSVWSEDRLVSATQGVQVTNGLFSVRLGDITPIPATLFASGALYFEIELATPATATSSSPVWTEGPMTPRNQLATSAYAYNSETLDGLDSTDFAAASGSNNYIQNTTSPQSANISIVGPANSSAVLSIAVGSSTGNLAMIGNGSTTGLSISNSGSTSVYGDLTVDTNTLVVNSSASQVGIGIAPSFKLHVVDTSTADNGVNVNSYFGLIVSPSSAPAATTSYSGIQSVATSTSANLNANTLIYGINGVTNNGGSGSLGAGTGVIGRTQNTGSGNISNAFGVYGGVLNGGAGTISSGVALYAATPTATTGAITNAYGLLVAAQSGAGITNSFGIYQQGASDLNHFSGSVEVNNTSSSAFSISNASSAKLFIADTSASRIYVGDSVADATGVALVLDTKNSAGDPTSVDGAMYYNSSTAKLRCRQNGTWRDCVGNLQQGYDLSTGSTTPEIKLDSTRGGLDIQDADTTIGASLLAVRGSNGAGLGSALFNVTNTGVTTFQNSTDSAAAFTISRAGSGGSLFVADTTNRRIQVGNATADATGVVLVLDTKNNAGDPTGVDGAMYYSSDMRSFRCYQNGVWRSCMGGLAYSNTAPATTITASGTGEQNFSLSHSIPGGSCQPGRVYRVTARGVYTTPNPLGGIGTITLRAKLAGTIVGATPAVNLTKNITNRSWAMDFNMTCITYSITGSVEGQGRTELFIGTAAGTSLVGDMPNTGTANNINLTTAQSLTLHIQYSVAEAGKSITLRQLVVEELGP